MGQAAGYTEMSGLEGREMANKQCSVLSATVVTDMKCHSKGRAWEGEGDPVRDRGGCQERREGEEIYLG